MKNEIAGVIQAGGQVRRKMVAKAALAHCQ